MYPVAARVHSHLNCASCLLTFFVQLIHSSNAVCSSNIGEFVNLISINQSLFLERYIKEDQSHTINLIAKILIEKSSEIDHQGRSKNFNVIFFLLLI